MTEIVEALRSITSSQFESDRALLKLCDAMLERIKVLEERVGLLQDGLETALKTTEFLLKKTHGDNGPDVH